MGSDRPGGLAGSSAPVGLGAQISENRKLASIVAAHRTENGRILVDLVFYDAPAGVVPRMTGLWDERDPVSVVLDGKSQSATLLKPLQSAGILVAVATAEDVAVAHGEFMDLIGDGVPGIEHLNQAPLTAAVRAAQTRPLAGAEALQRKVPVDQSPLIAAELACWGLVRWEEVSTPAVYVI